MTWYTPGEGQGGGPESPAPPPPPPSPPSAPPPPPPPPPSSGAAAPAPEYQYGQPAPGYGAPVGPQYAGWWRRVGAALIDGLILLVVSSVVQAIIGGQRIVENDPDTNTLRVQFGARGLTSTLIVVLLSLAYYTLLEGGAKGQSVGKMATGITLRDAGTGALIGYPRALGRRLLATVMAWALLLPWILSVLWPLWDDRKQTLHDKAVSSVVVTT